MATSVLPPSGRLMISPTDSASPWIFFCSGQLPPLEDSKANFERFLHFHGDYSTALFVHYSIAQQELQARGIAIHTASLIPSQYAHDHQCSYNHVHSFHVLRISDSGLSSSSALDSSKGSQQSDLYINF